MARLRYSRDCNSVAQHATAHLNELERRWLLKLTARLYGRGLSRNNMAYVMGVSHMTMMELQRDVLLRRNLHIRAVLLVGKHDLVKSNHRRAGRMVLESVPGTEASWVRQVFAAEGCPVERVTWEADRGISVPRGA